MDNEVVVSNRDKHLERMRKKYPDKKFEDEDEIYGAISDDYDEYEQELTGYRDREKTMSEMFAADPRSAQFLSDMYKGKSPWASYIKLFGPELKDSLDDPETAKQIAEAESEYVERVAKSRALEEEYEANMRTTLDNLQKFKEERGLSDEQIDEIGAVLIGIVRDGVMGKFAPETLDMIVKAINHDDDVATAAEEAEVAGRNARITENLRKSKKGDGTIPLDGKNGTHNPIPARQRTVFDEARDAK